MGRAHQGRAREGHGLAAAPAPCSAGSPKANQAKPALVARLSKMIETTPADGFIGWGGAIRTPRHHGPAEGHHAADARHRRRRGPGDAAGRRRGHPRQIAGSDLIVMPGVSHMLCAEDPAGLPRPCARHSSTSTPNSRAGKARMRASSCSAATAPSAGVLRSGWRREPGLEIDRRRTLAESGPKAFARGLARTARAKHQRGPARCDAEATAGGLAALRTRGCDQRIGSLSAAGLPAGAGLHRRRRALRRPCGCARLRDGHRRAGRGRRRRAGVLVVSGASTRAGACRRGDRCACRRSSPRWSAVRDRHLARQQLRSGPGHDAIDPGHARAPDRRASKAAGPQAPRLAGICSGAVIPGLGERWLGAVRYARPRSASAALSGPASVQRLSPRSRSAPSTWACGACPGWCAPACCGDPSGWLRRCWRLKQRARALGLGRAAAWLVTLEGRGPDGGRMRIEWRLIARQRPWPYIPAMPSVILAKRLLVGRVGHARRHAVRRPVHAGRFPGRSRRPRHQRRHRMTLPLYRRVLGDRFDALPARVRELHDLHA